MSTTHDASEALSYEELNGPTKPTEKDPYPWWSPSERGYSAHPDFDSVWSPGADYEQDESKYPPFAPRPPF